MTMTMTETAIETRNTDIKEPLVTRDTLSPKHTFPMKDTPHLLLDQGFPTSVLNPPGGMFCFFALADSKYQLLIKL
jgi:hypothetical protein